MVGAKSRGLAEACQAIHRECVAQARSVWFIWSVWSVSFVWLNKTNQIDQMNQTDQINKTGQWTF